MRRYLPLISLVFALAWIAGVPRVLAADEKQFVPSEFSFSEGSFWDGALSIELEGGVLTYTRKDSKGEVTKKITPTPAQWRAFGETVLKLNAPRWRGDYSVNKLDQLHWKISAKSKKYRVKTSGYGAFPDSTGRKSSWQTKEFHELCLAIEKLVGGEKLFSHKPGP